MLKKLMFLSFIAGASVASFQMGRGAEAKGAAGGQDVVVADKDASAAKPKKDCECVDFCDIGACALHCCGD
jgi:hypothetical protein